jgi:hypothetical protein
MALLKAGRMVRPFSKTQRTAKQPTFLSGALAATHVELSPNFELLG